MKIKILSILILFTFHLNALDANSVQHSVKTYMEKKMHSKVDKIEIVSTYFIAGTNGWEVYFLSLDIQIKMGKTFRKRTVAQVVFTKGEKLAFSLKDEKGRNYAKLLKPKVPSSAYDDAHFLVGNKDAPHKLLVMSDPFCPYCQEIVPEMIELVKNNPKKFSLYYYHLPLLRIHPASDVTTKVMYLLHERGDVANMQKLYHLVINPREKNANKILKAIKDKTGLIFTKDEINTEEVLSALAFDKRMKKRLMVTGTPTIFIDGIWDSTRFAYKKYLK